MLVQSRIAERMFGVPEVLIPAVRLLDVPGVMIDESVTEVTYVHLLFAQHQVIYAEGAPTESLYTGKEALNALAPAARAEITTLFPELCEDWPEPARPIPTVIRQRRLLERHLKNGQPLACETV